MAVRAGHRFRLAPAPRRVDDRFFREMVSSMRNGVLAVTTEGAMAVLNAEACRIFGMDADPADIGRPYAEVLRIHPDIVRVLAGAFELSHLPNRVEMRLKSTGRVIGYTLSHVRDTSGALSGVALFFKDLTRVEQLEERERLRDRLAALGEMAAAIAHELKNPLAGIEVMAGLLRRKVPGSPDAQSILTDIINEAKMANATVVEVLEYVRPVSLENERTSVADVLHAALATVEGKVPRGAVQVHTRIPRDLPAVHGDRHQLCQVFANLLINALEALAGRGSIWVTAEQSTIEGDPTQPDGPAHVPTVVVHVADNGPGLPPEMLDRMFNPFFTTKAQGSGLGLAIVRKIVDAHDGRIDVSSAAGLGTRFTVTLPVTGGDAEPFGTAPFGA
jgi:two-component system, NtrC family, sensor histidine kinase AtoS